MNLVYAEIVEVFVEEGMRMAKVRVGGAIRKAPLEVLTDAHCGDTVLLCDGVAIERVVRNSETNHVPGHTR